MEATTIMNLDGPDPRSRSHPDFPTLAHRAHVWATDGHIHEPWSETDDELSEAIERAVCGLLCSRYGHEIDDDHCGMPEHRYCLWCSQRMSFAPLGRQAPITDEGTSS